ncbi:DUF3556 domain-containing protein [Streptomyces sp. NBC_00258]|uniref:DUF3556 domain-containing protein n=1 Tax=Streptomyces sp. NBC_00258 TaxID=2903642 RepID=UPI003FA6FE82
MIVVRVESQPVHRETQGHRGIHASLGVVEIGTWKVSDCVEQQPSLPDRPIPVDVDRPNPDTSLIR